MSTTSGFVLAPEWCKQSGVMLTWPHSETIWAETLDTVDKVFADIAKHIARFEKVVITCFDAAHERHLQKVLQNADADLSQIAFYHAPCDDVWVRDHGPITVTQDGKPILLDFTFNGWGDKYPATNDNLITRSLHAQQAFGNAAIQSLDMVLEGGAIEIDGKGTLLTTSRCLLAKTRNPDLTQDDITATLKNRFGLNRILWLDEGYLAGDDTDGHIDTLARFTDAHTICYVTCDDTQDEHFTAFKNMEKQLKALVDYQGNPYKLIPLPWPKARFADYDGRRLPVTYANFLIINGAVLTPIYDDPADNEALHRIASCFPDREIIPIQSLALVQWYGSIHCMTMQLPEEIIL